MIHSPGADFSDVRAVSCHDAGTRHPRHTKPSTRAEVIASRAGAHIARARLTPWVAAAVVFLSGPRLATAQEYWSVHGGTTTLMVYHDVLDGLNVFLAESAVVASSRDTFSRMELAIADGPGPTFTVVDGSVDDVFGSDFQLLDGVDVLSGAAEQTVFYLSVADGESLGLAKGRSRRQRRASPEPPLVMHDVKVGFDERTGRFTLFSRDVRVSPELARVLGRPDLADVTLGTALIRADAVWVGGDQPTRNPDRGQVEPGTSGGGIGPDVTFCQLYNLRQYGRQGDLVGLSVATTSWNLGDQEVDWYGRPDSRHPFIIYNVLRIKDDRIEMIGQSWIKHGFCALDNSQCTTQCLVPTGCHTLSPGCTDTYSASLNASQTGLGPKSEVNPWTGEWSYEGSHFQQGPHAHDPVQHRIEVHDADLDPAQNPGATYFVESFYNCHDDVNPMNSAAWKPVSIASGEPGGTWVFTMSGSGTMPHIGFGIDAWTGARQTVLAQEVPPVRFVSPDGRCILAAKATDLGTGMWHYEYALLNVDMNRKAGAFSIPLMPGLTVTNIGFHAVERHDEPAYSNDPWDVTVNDEAITWTTVDNPLGWGALYNFRFDTNSPPGDATVTLGLFEPGSPDSVTGVTTGPVSQGPRIEHGTAHVAFAQQAFSGYIDPRMESDNGSDVNMGISQITIRFSEPVGNVSGGGLTTAAFAVRETGDQTPPSVTAISTTDNQTVTVMLDRIITPREWTTIQARVRNMAGNPIINRGDLGPGADEPDRIDIGFLPGDIDQNGDVQPLDLLRFRQMLTGVYSPAAGDIRDYADTDRSGSIAPLDLLRFRQLYSGTGSATEAWGGGNMNHPQP